MFHEALKITFLHPEVGGAWHQMLLHCLGVEQEDLVVFPGGYLLLCLTSSCRVEYELEGNSHSFV